MRKMAGQLDPLWFHTLISREFYFLVESLKISLDLLLHFMESKVMTRLMSRPTVKDRNEQFLIYLSKRNPSKAAKLLSEVLFATNQVEILDRLSLRHLIVDCKHLNLSLAEKPEIVKRFEEAFVEQSGYVPQQNSDVLRYYFLQKYGSAASQKLYQSSPGLCVIINNSTFVGFTQRNGSDKDVIKCESCFKALGYAVRKFENLTFDAFFMALAEIRYDIEDNLYQSLVLIVMSHGVDNHVVTVDNGFLHFAYDICGAFSGQNCPALDGLAKIFLIQACQTIYDEVPPRRDDTEGHGADLRDMFVFCATTPGSVANRYLPSDNSSLTENATIAPDIGFGSPFINRITEIIQKWGHIMTLKEIELEVNKYVADVVSYLSKGGSNQISSSYCGTLRKDFMFKYPF